MNTMNPNKFVSFSNGGQAIEQGNDFERWFQPAVDINDYNYYVAIETVDGLTKTDMHISKNIPDNKVSYSLSDTETALLTEGQYILEARQERISDGFKEEMWWGYANVFPTL